MAAGKHTKHSNRVRIIGGQCRGRKLSFTSADGLRPTPDSVRETLFNWLGQDLTGKTVLDLFGGSGALGIEAASRNAKRVLISDNNRQTVQTLQKNSRELGLGQVQIVFSDGIAYLKTVSEQFDVVFLDPPFAWQDWQILFDALKPCLNPRAFVYLEAGTLPDIPDWLTEYREGKSGQSTFELRVFQVAE
ncbi:16S rRNA (guanine(966)-N(2))-methyltransferase RsmD [Neisseria meningitidis]|uniref:16S rRNA (guanine(966)-N(2))-methyltransferase RsmD n=1 Tax=Neisseria meningitidis TaxID=487 RepID=UPI00027CB37A|nr:16S rRNA (guanine(966)-N(2))-methyltransferase RsmD [Neisseria meningitidis]EJU53474.1 RNA methyltransferase, RsmD family [Neisseria meningitidis 93003]MCL5931670.1 16S rRNA (guanine(966)-N(2))-methyltransferase RsmD [Neisseria meningitidis]